MTLFPDIPEEGPRIFSPAAINAAGFFVGGPMPAIPGGWLRLIQEAYVAPDPVPDTSTERKARRTAKRSALKARRAEELARVRAWLQHREANRAA